MKKLTPEELQSYQSQPRVEFIVKRYQEFAEEVDSIRKALSSANTSKQAIFDTIANMQKMHVDLSEQLKNFSGNTTHAMSNYVNHSHVMSSTIAKLSDEIVAVKTSLANIAEEVSAVKSSLVSAQEKLESFATKENINALSSEIKDVSNKSFSNYIVSQDMIVNIATAVERFKKLFDEVCLDLSTTKEKQNKMVEQLTALALVPQGLQQLIEEKVGSVKKQIDEKISSLKCGQDIQPPISKNDIEKQIQDMMVGVSLDAKNASLRSTNLEGKVLILDKKIEQLQLLINRLQLKGE